MKPNGKPPKRKQKIGVDSTPIAPAPRPVPIPSPPNVDSTPTKADDNPAWKVLVITEYLEDKPPLSVYPDWREAIANKYRVGERMVDAVLRKFRGQFEQDLVKASYEYAQIVMKAVGATRTKVVQTYMEGLVAQDEYYSKDDPLPRYRPNWMARLKAADALRDMYGMTMPQRVEVEHGVSDELSKLTQAELMVRLAEVQRDIQVHLKHVEHVEGAKQLAAPSTATPQ